jgi:hypothetical protein
MKKWNDNNVTARRLRLRTKCQSPQMYRTAYGKNGNGSRVEIIIYMKLRNWGAWILKHDQKGPHKISKWQLRVPLLQKGEGT